MSHGLEHCFRQRSAEGGHPKSCPETQHTHTQTLKNTKTCEYIFNQKSYGSPSPLLIQGEKRTRTVFSSNPSHIYLFQPVAPASEFLRWDIYCTSLSKLCVLYTQRSVCTARSNSICKLANRKDAADSRFQALFQILQKKNQSKLKHNCHLHLFWTI